MDLLVPYSFTIFYLRELVKIIAGIQTFWSGIAAIPFLKVPRHVNFLSPIHYRAKLDRLAGSGYVIIKGQLARALTAFYLKSDGDWTFLRGE